MNFDMESWLQELGIKDYDELTSVERETYEKMLEIAQSSQISLEDYKGYVKGMRESVENELASIEDFIYVFIFKRVNPKQVLLKARLKNYLLMESFFDRPERARKLLDSYKQRAKR